MSILNSVKAGSGRGWPSELGAHPLSDPQALEAPLGPGGLWAVGAATSVPSPGQMQRGPSLSWLCSDAFPLSPSQGAQGPMGPAGPAGARGIPVSICTSSVGLSMGAGLEGSGGPMDPGTPWLRGGQQPAPAWPT